MCAIDGAQRPAARRNRAALRSSASLLRVPLRSLGGAIGDPLNGSLFDLASGYRPLFLLMAFYTALAFLAVLLVPRGAGEANTNA